MPHSQACADFPLIAYCLETILQRVALFLFPVSLALPRSSLLLFKLSECWVYLVFLCSASYDLWIFCFLLCEIFSTAIQNHYSFHMLQI